MEPRHVLLLGLSLLLLLLLGTTTAGADVRERQDVQSDQPTPEYATCRYRAEDLRSSVRSAADSALVGLCNPAELSTRLLEMEQRLSHRLEELKQTFIRLLIDGVAYDYDEDGDASEDIEHHRYTGGAGAGSTGDDAYSESVRRGGLEAHNRVSAASTAQKTTYRSASEAARGAATSADGGSDSAASQSSGSYRSSSSHYASRGSSRRPSADASAARAGTSGVTVSTASTHSAARTASADTSGGARAGAGGTSRERGQEGRWSSTTRKFSSNHTRAVASTSGAASAEDADSAAALAKGSGSRGSISRDYSYQWKSSSRGSSSGASGDHTHGGGASGGSASAQSSGGKEGEARHSSSSGSSSRHYSYGRRTSAGGSSGSASEGQGRVSQAIGGAGYSGNVDSQNYGSSRRSGSRRYSSERRTSSQSSSGVAAGENSYNGVVDFGPDGGPQQTSWFPGTSRTTTGTGVPDLSGTVTRTGGFGFGAVGEPLDEADSSRTSAGARVRSGGAASAAGSGTVAYRDSQTYGGSPESRRPGSIAGGSTDQYVGYNTSGSTSGQRQVSAYDVSRHSRQGGTEVRFENSYTPTDSGDAYLVYNSQRNRASSSHSRHSGAAGGRTNRRRGSRRHQRVYDTVSSISGQQSVPMSRYLEVDTYNDTVYEMDGKRRYSYYWEVDNFRTMMATWEHRHSLRSPSFYVYQGGYRMYIRVFPSRQGGNVYLHTGLTPGRYDGQLWWPFPLRLRLSLLDHSNLQHDIRSRIWDPRKLCSGWNWKRPRRKDNFECVGLGFPQSLLETQRFIKDGAVVIKLDVFLED